jgi:hypothetical protein
MQSPKLICLTPVRNEEWILEAFLKATSLWADHILICDQHSTDNSKFIASSFPKVILVENPDYEMNQAKTRKILFKEAKKITGNKIIFSLDADEFFSDNFIESPDWKTILNSNPGDVFLFRWKNLIGDPYIFQKSYSWMYWGCHIKDDFFEGVFPDNYIHEWRLPWPSGQQEFKEYLLENIFLLHFARVNLKRFRTKEIYYQVITKYNEPNISSVRLFRSYNIIDFKNNLILNNDAFSYYFANKLNIFDNIKLNDKGSFYLHEINRLMAIKGLNYFQSLDIWDQDLLKNNNYRDPRSIRFKLLHFYLKITRPFSNYFLIKAIDKILKYFGF